jgi:hypothetical protein
VMYCKECQSQIAQLGFDNPAQRKTIESIRWEGPCITTALDPRHQREWADSGVDAALVALNVKTLTGDAAWEHLFYSPGVPRLNSGRLNEGTLRTYRHLDDGGWWVSGLDPRNDWQEMTWGRFKPNSPRLDCKKGEGKPVKYESPPKEPSRVTYFQVPKSIWQQVSQRWGVPMPAPVEAISFWQWVQSHPEICLVLTEGEKKAAALLSQGIVAVALPGIWMGTRKVAELRVLHPDLLPMAQAARKFTILFDYESRPQVQQAIRLATLRLGKAIREQGCRCDVAQLPGPEKGIDDWIAALGERAAGSVTVLLEDAVALADYEQSAFINRCRGLQQYQPHHRVSSRYLADAVQLPQRGLVVLCSDMGTGKTELIERWRTANPEVRFLNNGHRVNLLKHLSGRLKTQLYSTMDYGDLANASALSITADSLYKLASDVDTYGCVFIDEACQYLAHVLTSKTCKEHQAEILESLEYFVHNAPLVVIADAHMTDTTIQFFQSMRPAGETPFIIHNSYQAGDRNCYWYEGSDNSGLIAEICAAVGRGKKAMVVSDSKRFIKKLEHLLMPTAEESGSLCPSLKVWSIHGENSGSEDNVAFIANIRDAVKDVDVLLASPSLGTGVDIPDYHFDAVFGAFHAASQTATECAQMLWRYRPSVPMHVWVAAQPLNGFKSCNASKIKQTVLESNRMTAFLIRRDKVTGERGAEKDWALNAYCQIQAQRNFSINNLRADLKSLLEGMGNRLTHRGNRLNEPAAQRMKSVGQEIDAAYCAAVTNAPLIDARTYRLRQSKEYLSPEETIECEKYRIWDAYGKDVSPELVDLDHAGGLITRLIALEELLAAPGEPDSDSPYPQPPERVREKDAIERELMPLCFHWRNRSTSWLARMKLGLHEIVQGMIQGAEIVERLPELQALVLWSTAQTKALLGGQAWLTQFHQLNVAMAELARCWIETAELTNKTPAVVQLKDLALKHSKQVKELLGLSIPASESPIWVLSQCLKQFGLRLECRRIGSKGQQVRHYFLDPVALKFAQEVLGYRERRYRERERHRQEDRERNQVYAAQMQDRYGTQPIVTIPPKASESTLLESVTTTDSGSQKEVSEAVGAVSSALTLGQEAVNRLWRSLRSGLRVSVVSQLFGESGEEIDLLAVMVPDLFADFF